MDNLEEIRNRISIEQLVAEYVQMKPAGRNFKALCPFHNEKTPSFVISPEKQIAYCFGCQKGGDIFKFLMEVENIPFNEALNILAQKAGIQIQNKRGKNNTTEKNKLYLLNEEATKFYQTQLQNQKTALAYLGNRGLTTESIRKFQIGFAPDDYHKLHKHLERQGYSQKEIVLSGNASSQNNQHIFDRFRNRIMFPLWSNANRFVGFSGRSLSMDDKAKYLNTPDTPIFQKNQILYGLKFAKKKIKELDCTILVEGQMDVIATHQSGTENVVATSGTALTTNHLKILKRLSSNIILALDNDNAGQQATMRAISMALAQDFNIQVANLGAFKDPDEIILKSPEKWKKIITNSISWFDYYFAVIFINENLADPISIKKIEKIVLKNVNLIQSKVLQEFYLKELAHKLKVSPEALQADLKKLYRKEKNFSTEKITPQKFGRSEYLLGLILTFPQYIDILKDHNLETDMFLTFTKPLFEKILKASSTDFKTEQFINTLKNIDLENYLKVLMLFIESNYKEMKEKALEEEILGLVEFIKKDYQKKRTDELIVKLKTYEKEGKTAEIEQLLKEFGG